LQTRGFAARFPHFANVWQNHAKFAKHWQIGAGAGDSFCGQNDGKGSSFFSKGFPLGYYR
jgi:hypothetical protein